MINIIMNIKGETKNINRYIVYRLSFHHLVKIRTTTLNAFCRVYAEKRFFVQSQFLGFSTLKLSNLIHLSDHVLIEFMKSSRCTLIRD